MSHRFSIAGIMGFVAVVGFWLAALRSASEFWERATALFTLALLLTSTRAAIVSRGPARSFWLGFTLFAWICMEFGHLTWLRSGVRQAGETFFPADAQSQSEGERFGKLFNFSQIGERGSSLLFAMLGGLIGRWFAARREMSRPNRPQPD